MATAYSGEVSVGTYNRIRIKCDYSGTSATCTVQFRRTQAYSGYWGDSRATLTFNGTTKNAGYSYSGTAGTSWINLVTVSGYSVSTSGGTYNWNFSNPGGGVLGCSGTIVIGSQGSAPSDLAISLVEATWNSVTMETTVGNWGTGTNWQRAAYLLEVPYVAGVDKYHADSTNNTTQPVELTVGTQSLFEFSNNPFVVYGCKEYYTGLWASTTVDATRLQGPTFYTAPYKLDSLTYTSETFDGSTITATIAAKTNSTWNKSGATVGFLYQVSTDGGETFDGWKYLSTTATVGTTANLSIPNLQPGTAYVVEVAQICMDADIKYSSESSFVNFTTQKYRKIYGPGDGYATYVPENETNYTIENTTDNGIKVSMLGGKTSQDSVNSSDPKNLMPLSPITAMAVSSSQGCTYEYVWDDELKQTVLHMKTNGTYPGIFFNTTNYGITSGKNYAISVRYKFTTNYSTQQYGGVSFGGRNNWEIMGSNNNTGVKPSPVRSELTPTTSWKVATVRISKDAPEWTAYGNSGKAVSIVTPYQSNDSTRSDIWVSDIMVEEITDAQYSADTFIPVFTPYTAKQVAPTPDAPMTVKTVTGRQTFKITGANGAEQEYEINLGKNLLKTQTSGTFTTNGVTATANSDGTITLNGTASANWWIEVVRTLGYTGVQSTPFYGLDGGEIYTLSGKVVSGTFNGSLSCAVQYDYNGGSVALATAINTSKQATGVKAMYRCWIYGFSGNTYNNTKIALQFEKGPEATSWAPYFEPIELNHLGLYQDWILYSGGKWLLNKATGKVDLGTQTWSSVSGIAGLRKTTGIPNIQYVSSNTQLGDGIANNYTMHTGSGMSAASALNNIAIDVSQVSVNTGSDSIDPTGTFRYALVIPTFDEITNQYVLEGLEKLRKLGHTYIGATTFSLNGYGNEEVAPVMSVTTNSDNLPPYYQRLQYIESDGNQYIATPVIPTTAYRLELIAAWTYGSCGGSNHPSEGRTLFDMRNIASGNVGIYAGSTARTFTGISTGKHTYYIDYYNSVMGIDNETYPLASGQIPSTKALAIGAWFEGGVYYYKATGKTYRFTVYNLGEKIYDFVPCKSLKDNKVGMYDVINHKFYPCSVSGYDYTAGPSYASLSTKQIHKLYGPKPAKKNLIDVPINYTVTSTDHFKSIPVAMASGTAYTLHFENVTSDGATQFLALTFNGSTQVGTIGTFTASTKSITYTPSGDVTNIYLYSSKNLVDSGNYNTTYHGLMLEEGTSASKYEAYSNGIGAGKSRRIKKLYGPTPSQVNLIHVGPTNTIESTATSQGITHYRDRLTCEEVTTIGTASTTWSNFGPQYTVSWPAGTYTLSIDHKLPFSVIIQINTGSAANKIIPVGSTSVTFTTTATTNSYYFFIGALTSGKYYNETFKLQLVKGSTPDYDFKLYSDGTNANITKLIYNG